MIDPTLTPPQREAHYEADAGLGIGFARFLGVLWPAIDETNYLLKPIHLSEGYAVSLSTAQLVGILLIALLTWTNICGLDYGKWIQNLFTVTKTGALLGLIVVGLALGWNADVVSANFGDAWAARGFSPVASGLT